MGGAVEGLERGGQADARLPVHVGQVEGAAPARRRRRQVAKGGVVNFRVLDLEQRSDAWHDARCGLLTGSAAAAMLAMKKGKKGAPGGEMEKRAQLRERLA